MSVILSLKQMVLHRDQRSCQRPHKLGQSRSYKWKKQVIAEHVTVGKDALFSLLCFFFLTLSLYFFADQRKKEVVGEKDISIQSVFTDNCDTSLFFWVFCSIYSNVEKS